MNRPSKFGPPPQPRLSFEPLRHWLMQRLGHDAFNRLDVERKFGVPAQTTLNWERQGVPLFNADRLLIRLGAHPSEVWGDEYWDAA
jgi:hypothetical protein